MFRPFGKYWKSQLHFPLDRDLSSGLLSGYRYPPFKQLGPGMFYGLSTFCVINYRFYVFMLGMSQVQGLINQNSHSGD